MSWLHPRRFDGEEKRWIAVCFLLLASLGTAPYIIFALLTPEYQQYAWCSVFHYDDYFQYYAWARHIADGEWLIRNYYTNNPGASYALFNPFFLPLGWTTRLFGNVYFAYHLLRIVAIGVFSWISYAFISLFHSEIRLRKIAQLLFLGGGLEFPYFQLFHTRNPTPLADPYVYKLLYRYGHLTVALCLLLIIFGAFVQNVRNSKAEDSTPLEMRPWTALAVALATFFLGLINPYYLVLVAAVATIHSAWLVTRGFRHSVPLLAALGLGAIPPFLHYRMQPITLNLGSIGFDDPIGPLDILLFFGILLPGAIVGWKHIFQSRDTGRHLFIRYSFIATWALVVLGLIVTPLPFRARMVFGLSIGLSILMTYWIGQLRQGNKILYLVFALLLIDPVFTFYKESIDVQQRGVGRIDRATLAAFDYIDQHARRGDVVVTTVELGNYLPAYSPANTYVGHSFQTENFEAKVRELSFFFHVATERQRIDFLNSVSARYVLLPPSIRPGNRTFDLPGWTRIYNRFGHEIYERP